MSVILIHRYDVDTEGDRGYHFCTGALPPTVRLVFYVLSRNSFWGLGTEVSGLGGGLPFIGSTPKDKYARYHPALYLLKKRFPGYILISQVEQPGEPS